MKDLIRMKKEELTVKFKRPQVVIIGEDHGDLRSGVMALKLLNKGYNVVAHEGLTEGRKFPGNKAYFTRILRELEKTVFEVEKEVGSEGFAGLENITEQNIEEQINYLKRLNEILMTTASVEAARGNKEKVMRIIKKRSNIRKLYTLLSELRKDPFLAVQYKLALLGSKASVVGIDSPVKKDLIKALKEGNEERLQEIDETRNRVMAENIERLAREGHRIIALMGDSHVEEVEKHLKRRGIRVHSIRFGSKQPRTVKEYVERLIRSEEYFRDLEKILKE